jgi:hypothetical protein
MIKVVLAGAVLAVAATATAQTSVGNPPGNTLAPATGTVTATPAPPPAAPAGDMVAAKTPEQIRAEKYKTEVVCKTAVETGSLIARHKTCLTRAQWQYVSDENERQARKLVEDNNRIGGAH